jgi:hypothetical protein
MIYLRLLRSPLLWAAVAGLMAWAAWGQFQRANAADAARRAAEEASRILSDFTIRQRDREADLLAAIGDLANVPDTTACADSPAMRAALDRLRAGGRP